MLENKDGSWRPGMFVNAELVTEEIEVPVAVLADAIQTLGDWTVVFGRYGRYFEARPLELGRSDGKMIEVLNGFIMQANSTRQAIASPSRQSWENPEPPMTIDSVPCRSIRLQQDESRR